MLTLTYIGVGRRGARVGRGRGRASGRVAERGRKCGHHFRAIVTAEAHITHARIDIGANLEEIIDK